MSFLALPSSKILTGACDGEYTIANYPPGSKVFVETDGTMAVGATVTLGRVGLKGGFAPYLDADGNAITMVAGSLEGVIVGKRGTLILKVESSDGTTNFRVETGQILNNGSY